MKNKVKYGVAVSIGLLLSSITQAESRFDRKIRHYIMGNPGVIEASLDQIREQAAEKRLNAKKLVVIQNIGALRAVNATTTTGNPTGRITMVEFFDYGCGMCRRAYRSVESVIESNQQIRAVFNLLPIFGQSSQYAALMDLYAGQKGRYTQFHRNMFSLKTKTRRSVDFIDKVAQKSGIRLSPAAIQTIHSLKLSLAAQKRIALARKLKINGTPYFLIFPSKGKLTVNMVELVPGAAPREVLQEAIDRVSASLQVV